MISTFESWILTVFGSVATVALALAVPAVRELIGKYVAGFVQHHFDQRIETLRSDLRRSEEKFAADLRASEQQVRSLADAALSLRSSRQVALDARRLLAVEKLWAAKIATDRMKMAATVVATLNMEEMFKAAESGDPKIRSVAETLCKMAGVELTKGGDLTKQAPQASALSERPFLPSNVWALFSAYQGVITTSMLLLNILAIGTTQFIKKEDLLKPLMLSVLPEYKDYIEKYGFSGYSHLLDILEQKLLNVITEMLEGKDMDAATVRRSAEIMAAVRAVDAEKKVEIPNSLRGPEVPEPPKM